MTYVDHFFLVKQADVAPGYAPNYLILKADRGHSLAARKWATRFTSRMDTATALLMVRKAWPMHRFVRVRVTPRARAPLREHIDTLREALRQARRGRECAGSKCQAPLLPGARCTCGNARLCELIDTALAKTEKTDGE